jgi:DUF917 family protein
VLDKFEQWIGRKATHIIPFEVGGGNSVVPLVAAAVRGLPLVDGDGMGRALPEAQMMTFAIQGVRPTPAASLDYLGNSVFFDTPDTALFERLTRAVAMTSGGMIFTAEHPMTGKQARDVAVPGTISFAAAVGRLLRERRGSADEIEAPLARLFSGSQYGAFRRLYTGKITDVMSRTEGGFDVGEARIESFGGDQPPMRIAIRNEYLAAWVGDKVVASVPDLITIVDHESSRPINTERLRYGQRVTVFGIGCPPHYRTEAALKVVAPRCFGFDFDFQPLG